MILQFDGFDWDRVFTLRRKGDKQMIRPISARYMHKKEIESYEKENSGV
jgi:uncharacterized DUF497 family protein